MIKAVMPGLNAIKKADSKLYELVVLTWSVRRQVMPDDHSEVVPLLPIPNRTVKRLCADDSADSRVKVGHRQALTAPPKPHSSSPWNGAFAIGRSNRAGVELGLNSLADSRLSLWVCAEPTVASFQAGCRAARSSRRKILPTFDFGSSSRNSMYLGSL